MIHNVLIVGYGTMGRGIASSFVTGGHRVTVLSRNPDGIGDIPGGVEITGELPEGQPDLIIEAVPEQIEIKNSLFARLERTYGGKPILATGTSGLSMEAMAEQLDHPDRFIGIHYFQPPQMFPSVEVILVEQTDPRVLDDVATALKSNGQDAVVINRPIVGFLANRLQHAMLHEAFSLIEQGVVTAHDVDQVCKTMFGPRLCVTGLIEQKDIGGLDIAAATQRNLVPHLCHTGTPTRMIQEMVGRGEIGVKSGKGFYDWSDRDIETHRRRTEEKLIRVLAILSEE